jgi:hypothetical protein
MRTFTFKDLANLALELDSSDPTAVAEWRELYAVYQKALDDSTALGFVGVGCLTYAEETLNLHYGALKLNGRIKLRGFTQKGEV